MISHFFGLTIHYLQPNQQLLIKASLKYYDLLTDTLQTYDLCVKQRQYTPSTADDITQSNNYTVR